MNSLSHKHVRVRRMKKSTSDRKRSPEAKRRTIEMKLARQIRRDQDA
jgi:hypothetical protein